MLANLLVSSLGEAYYFSVQSRINAETTRVKNSADVRREFVRGTVSPCTYATTTQ